jgi:dihydroneopterin triphosphate diphosphatase
LTLHPQLKGPPAKEHHAKSTIPSFGLSLCKRNNGHFEYALMKRADDGIWQGIAGDGEDAETPFEAALRETYEEAGLAPASEYIRLDSIASVPVAGFRDSPIWGEDVYVIPQHSFGVAAHDVQITISHEHTEYKWFTYEEACSLIKYDGSRTALWELDQRLKGNGPRG